MSKELIVRPTRWHIIKRDAPLFDEYAYTVAIDDEAAGEYVVFTSYADQDHAEMKGVISIDPADWPTIRAQINKAVRRCRV